MANIPRGPIYVKYWPPRWWPSTTAQNFYKDIVIGVVPSKQTDWPGPKRSTPPIHHTQPLGSPSALTRTPPVAPKSKFDWPPPTQPPFTQYLQSQPQGSPLVLPRGGCAFQFIAFQIDGFQVCQAPFALDIWPTPPRSPDFIYSRAQSIPATLAQPVQAAPPISQQSWPVPIQPFRVTADLVEFETNFQILFSTQPPNRQDRWPPPIQPYRVYADSYEMNLAVFFGTQPPNNQSQWPLPTPPPRVYAQSYSTFPALFPQNPPINLADWPRPILPPVVRADAIGAFLPLLQSVQPQISQPSWPVPIQPPRVYAQSYSTGPTLLGVTPTPVDVSSPPLWPIPVQPYLVYAEVRRAHIDLLQSVQPPISQSDWPVPKRVPPFFYSQNYGLYTLQLEKPFKQTDWPVPVQPYRVYAEVRRADLQLLTSTQPPNAQLQWPVPTQPYRVYAQSYATPTALLTPATPPISLTDWPLPTQPARVYAAQFRAPIGLLHSVKPPNRQLDWPLPKLVREIGKFWRQEGFTPLQQSVRPFTQADWPNPKQVFIPTTGKTWLQSVSAAMLRQPPNRLSDWPNPWLQQTTKIRSQSYSPPTPLLTTPVTRPFRLDIWPVSLFYQHLHLYYSPEAWQGIAHGQANITPPPTPPPPPPPHAAYESQVGVWHPKQGVHGRTGKRYRIYGPPEPAPILSRRFDATLTSTFDMTATHWDEG